MDLKQAAHRRRTLATGSMIVALALAGCSGDTTGSTTGTQAPPATQAPTEVIEGRLNGLGLVLTDDQRSCVSRTTASDPRLAALGDTDSSPTAEQTKGMVEVLFGCGVTNDAFADLFVRALAMPLPDDQDACVHTAFSTLTGDDLTTLLVDPGSSVADTLTAQLRTTCGLADPSSTPAPEGSGTTPTP